MELDVIPARESRKFLLSVKFDLPFVWYPKYEEIARILAALRAIEEVNAKLGDYIDYLRREGKVRIGESGIGGDEWMLAYEWVKGIVERFSPDVVQKASRMADKIVIWAKKEGSE